MGEKKGNNRDEKKNNNGGEGIHMRFLIKGAEFVKVDLVPNKLRVIAEVDLGKPRDMVEPKGKKKVELVSPLQKKDNKKGGGDDGGGGGGQKDEGKPQKKSDEKKTKDKEPPVTTAVIKLELHCCLGCIETTKKIITKTKGYHDMSIDKQKNQITVKGTMNMKALADTLKEKLKKPVEIVPPKKQGGGNKKEKGGAGEKKEKGGGEGGKGKKDGGGVLPKK